MNEEKIYPTMVIRSQAEAIELLEQENEKLKDVIEELWNFIKKYPGISQSGVMTIKEILDKVGD